MSQTMGMKPMAAKKKIIDVTSLVALTVAKMFGEPEEKAARAAVESNPDGYVIDATIRVTGRLKVGMDFPAENAQRLCPWRLFQLAINKMNAATRDAMVEEIMVEYARGDAPDTDALKSVTAAAAAKLLSKTSGVSKGMVKFEGTMFEVGASR